MGSFLRGAGCKRRECDFHDAFAGTSAFTACFKTDGGSWGEVPVVGPTLRSSIPGVSQCGLWSTQRMVLLPKYAAPIVLSQTS